MECPRPAGGSGASRRDGISRGGGISRGDGPSGSLPGSAPTGDHAAWQLGGRVQLGRYGLRVDFVRLHIRLRSHVPLRGRPRVGTRRLLRRHERQPDGTAGQPLPVFERLCGEHARRRGHWHHCLGHPVHGELQQPRPLLRRRDLGRDFALACESASGPTKRRIHTRVQDRVRTARRLTALRRLGCQRVKLGSEKRGDLFGW